MPRPRGTIPRSKYMAWSRCPAREPGAITLCHGPRIGCRPQRPAVRTAQAACGACPRACTARKASRPCDPYFRGQKSAFMDSSWAPGLCVAAAFPSAPPSQRSSSCAADPSRAALRPEARSSAPKVWVQSLSTSSSAQASSSTPEARPWNLASKPMCPDAGSYLSASGPREARTAATLCLSKAMSQRLSVPHSCCRDSGTSSSRRPMISRSRGRSASSTAPRSALSSP
mmetsp:Transcript_91388/g.258352  ORF Transcript_91388/g.258352 Transcript_91388/m.258352 type:complete len:228 (-) Transcript_91388:1459-2142(-)